VALFNKDLLGISDPDWNFVFTQWQALWEGRHQDVKCLLHKHTVLRLACSEQCDKDLHHEFSFTY
jgi:hypothetical protein